MLRDAIRSATGAKPRLFFLGQAGFAIQNGRGKWLLIDPCLSDSVRRFEGNDGFKRLSAPPVTPEEMPCDVLVATHPHADHFDVDTVPALMAEGACLFASEDCERLVREGGIDPARVRYVRPGDREEAEGFRLHFIRCDHGEAAPDAVGLLIETDGVRLLFVGDTCLRPDYSEDYLSDGPVDVMAACINGRYGNMDYADCARLTHLLAPALTVPCHFGLFASHGGRPDLYYKTMTEDYPEHPFLFMAPGEEYLLKEEV